MKIAVVGAGIIGLALCRALLLRYENLEIDLYDQFSIPSKGTSMRNSGVLHAGLYYKPNSLKARMCKLGTALLLDYIHDNGLPLLNCGKILVPFGEVDHQNLLAIKRKADANGCETELITHEFAERIQQGIVGQDSYLWSPLTKVFSPGHILNQLTIDLQSSLVNFCLEKVRSICSSTTTLLTHASATVAYDYIFNVAGPGALRLYQQDLPDSSRLALLPILGQYANLTDGPGITTNLYPVPDLELPFLGVHVTPRNGELLPILGPNAVPIFREYLDEYGPDDLLNVMPRLSIEAAMFIGNACNFRNHAMSELTISPTRKFYTNTVRFFNPLTRSSIKVAMAPHIYGIRPQLVNLDTLTFFDDFICKLHGRTLHVVNAVSPAFTSSMALAEHLIDTTL